MDRLADSCGEIDQRHQREQPEGRGQRNVCELHSATKVAVVGRGGEAAGIVDLVRQLVHGDAKRGGVGPHVIAVAYQVIQAVATVPGVKKTLLRAALGEGFHRRWPGIGVAGSKFLRSNCAGLGLLPEVFALVPVELEAGVFERAGERFQLIGGGEVQGKVEEAGGDPNGGAEREQSSGDEDEDQPVAEAVHPILPRRTRVRGRSFSRSGPAERVHEISPLGARLKISIRLLRLMPESPTSPASSRRSVVRISNFIQNGRSGVMPSALIASWSKHHASACAAVRFSMLRLYGPGMVTANFSSHKL